VEEAEEGAGDVGVGERAEAGPMGGGAPGAGVAVDLELDGEDAGGAVFGGEDVVGAGEEEGEVGGGGGLIGLVVDGAVDGPKEFEGGEFAADGEGGGGIGEELDGDVFGDAELIVGGEGVGGDVGLEIGESFGDFGEGVGHLEDANKYLTWIPEGGENADCLLGEMRLMVGGMRNFCLFAPGDFSFIAQNDMFWVFQMRRGNFGALEREGKKL
jgi:hypothetical protein